MVLSYGVIMFIFLLALVPAVATHNFNGQSKKRWDVCLPCTYENTVIDEWSGFSLLRPSAPPPLQVRRQRDRSSRRAASNLRCDISSHHLQIGPRLWP